MSTHKVYKNWRCSYTIGHDYHVNLVDYRLNNREIWNTSHKALYMVFSVIENRHDLRSNIHDFNNVFRTECLSVRKKVIEFDKRIWGRTCMQGQS